MIAFLQSGIQPQPICMLFLLMNLSYTAPVYGSAEDYVKNLSFDFS